MAEHRPISPPRHSRRFYTPLHCEIFIVYFRVPLRSAASPIALLNGCLICPTVARVSTGTTNRISLFLSTARREHTLSTFLLNYPELKASELPLLELKESPPPPPPVLNKRSRISTNAEVRLKNLGTRASSTCCPVETEAVSRSSPRSYRLATHVTIWKVEREDCSSSSRFSITSGGHYDRCPQHPIPKRSGRWPPAYTISRCTLHLVLNGGLAIFFPRPLEIIARSGTTGELDSFVSDSLLRPRCSLRRRGS